MFELGLENGALAIASHACLIGALGLMVWRLVGMLDGEIPQVAMRRGLVAGLAIFLWGLISERSYYVAARFLRSLGYNLWQMHPAPEVLSLMVFFTLYALKGPFIFASLPPRLAMRRIGTEIVGFIALWFTIVLVLY